MAKPQFPVNHVGITKDFKGSAHKGIDLGWHTTPNEPIIAPLDMTIVVNTNASDAGNFVVAKACYSDTQDYLFRFLHLKDKPNLIIEQVIKQGNQFAIMGNTGKSNGNHLHFEVWIVPKNYIYAYSDVMNYVKNPLEYIYLYPNQTVSNGSADKVMKYVPIQYYGTPVAREEGKEQIEILITNLRARTSPNGDILGYINKGIYNILEAQNNGDYTWFMVEDNTWIAYSNEWAFLYEAKPVEQPIEDVPENPIDKPTDEQMYEDDKTPTEDTNVPVDGSDGANGEHLNDSENIWLKILNLIIKLIKLIKGER